MDYRFATPEDTPLILYFIKELASYEKRFTNSIFQTVHPEQMYRVRQ